MTAARVALLVEISCFYSMLMPFGHCHFGSWLANGRMLRGGSCYSSNDWCGLHCYAGRGVVISSVQKIMCPTIPGVQWLILTTYSSSNLVPCFVSYCQLLSWDQSSAEFGTNGRLVHTYVRTLLNCACPVLEPIYHTNAVVHASDIICLFG